MIETVDVRVAVAATGDSEVLRLSETGANTGVFVGYIATAARTASADCALQVERNAQLDATYVDPTDNTDAAQADALVDPFGLVFDSQTGAAINGARVRLIDVTTGLPAVVFGDDGVSRYPERNGDRPAGDRPGRHAVQHAGGCVPIPARRAWQLPSRSGAAWQPRVPFAAHGRPTCRRCRMLRSACSRVRTVRRSS